MVNWSYTYNPTSHSSDSSLPSPHLLVLQPASNARSKDLPNFSLLASPRLSLQSLGFKTSSVNVDPSTKLESVIGSGVLPLLPRNVDFTPAPRADHAPSGILKAHQDNIVVSYTISEDRSGDRGNRILSRIEKRKCGSREVRLKVISSYASRLGLRDRRNVSTRNVEEHDEQIDSEAESIVLPPMPFYRIGRPSLSTVAVGYNNTNRGIVSNTSKGQNMAYPSDEKKSTIPLEIENDV